MKRYQLTFGLFLVSSLGVGAGENQAPVGAGAGAPGNPFQQRQQADAQAALIGAQARQQEAAEVARLEQGIAAANKEIAASKAKQVQLKEVITQVVAGANNSMEDAITKMVEMKVPDAIAVGTLARVAMAPFMDEKNKILGGVSPEAIAAKKKQLETGATDQIRNARMIASAAIKPNRPETPEPIATTFKTAIELPFKDVEPRVSAVKDQQKKQASDMAEAFAAFIRSTKPELPNEKATTMPAAQEDENHSVKNPDTESAES